MNEKTKQLMAAIENEWDISDVRVEHVRRIIRQAEVTARDCDISFLSYLRSLVQGLTSEIYVIEHIKEEEFQNENKKHETPNASQH